MYSQFKDRLQFIIDNFFDGKKSRLAEHLDVQPSKIGNYFQKDSQPRLDVIQGILKVSTDINPEWLINGKGEPLLSHTDAADIEDLLTKNSISYLLFQKDNIINEKDARIKNLEDEINQLKKMLDYFLAQQTKKEA